MANSALAGVLTTGLLFLTMARWALALDAAVAPTGEGNVLMEFFTGNFDCKVADLSKLAPAAKIHVPNVNILRNGENNPTVHGIKTGNNWAARFTGWVHIAKKGSYKFQVSKWQADSAALSIDGAQLFSSECGENTPSATIHLKAGYHLITLTYTDDGWEDQVVLSYQGPDTAGRLMVVPPARLVASNVLMEYFAAGMDCKNFNDLSGLKPHTVLQVPNVDIKRRKATEPTIYGIRTARNWGARFTSELHIAHGGLYTFKIEKGPADSASLTIGGHRVFVSKCGEKAPTGQLSLSAGNHDLKVVFNDDGWKDKVVLKYKGSDTDGAFMVVPPNRFFVAQWVLGKEGQDCTTVCSALGKSCDEAALAAVDTAAEVKRVADAASYACSSTVAWAYDNNPGICTNRECCLDGSCTGACAYGTTGKRTCAGRPSGHYSRLCPCSARPLFV